MFYSPFIEDGYDSLFFIDLLSFERFTFAYCVPALFLILRLVLTVYVLPLLYVFVTLLSVTAYPPSMAVGWNIYVIWTI